ncbi:MAG: hypothetical protein HYY23_20695 [Verrucomicrobia bacterium]|nr:hypothetical protein [Verrucomicrobiota bacterium]
MKKTTPIFVAIVGVAFSVFLVAQQQTSGQEKRAAGAEPNRAVIEKLEQIVAIREGQLQSYEVQLQAGRATVIDGSPETELADARIRLAREKNQEAAVVTELRNLVATLERRMKKVEVLARDRLAPGDIDRFKLALLEAEIRLLRAQK